MADNKSFTLSVILKAIDNLTGPLRQVASQLKAVDDAAKDTANLKAMAGDLESIGKTGMLFGGAIVAGMTPAVLAFRDLEDARTAAKIAFMTGSGTDPLFGKIADDAQRLGTLLPGNTADFMEMAAVLKQLGTSADAIANGGLDATADLRVLIRTLSPEMAADVVATFVKSLKVPDKDLVPFVDQVQRAFFAFGLKPEDFAETLKFAGPMMQAYGTTGLSAARDALAFAGSMAQVGISASMLGTSMRALLDRISMIGEDTRFAKESMDILGRSGIKLNFFDGKGNFAGFENVIKQVEKLDALSQKDRMFVLNQLFGARAGSMLSMMAINGDAGFRRSLSTLDAQASMTSRVGVLLGTLANNWKTTFGTIKNTLAALGGPIAGDLKTLLQWLNKAAAAVGAFAEANPTLVLWLSRLAAAIGIVSFVGGALIFTLGAAIMFLISLTAGLVAFSAVSLIARARLAGIVGSLYDMVTAIGSGVVGALRVAAIASWEFLAPWLANPITWIVLGVVALGAAAIALIAKWDTVRAFFRRLWDDIRPPDWLLNFQLPDWLSSLPLIGRFFGGGNNGGTTGPDWRSALAPARSAAVGVALALPASGAIASQRQLTRQSAAAVSTASTPIGGVHLHYAPVVHLAPGSPKESASAVSAALESDRAALQKMVADLVNAEAERRARMDYR